MIKFYWRCTSLPLSNDDLLCCLPTFFVGVPVLPKRDFKIQINSFTFYSCVYFVFLGGEVGLLFIFLIYFKRS